MKKPLWVAAITLLVLCLRVNASRSVDGAADCLTPGRVAISSYGCTTTYSWSISLKLPWRMW